MAEEGAYGDDDEEGGDSERRVAGEVGSREGERQPG